jgi:fructose/tagatose bisphosphate aldolase
MNNTLVIAFYAEGTTDIRFLSKIILRTTEEIILNRSQSIISVLEPFPIEVKKTGDRIQEIRQAAAKAYGYNILIIHADADYEIDEKAFKERINPGFESVKLDQTEEFCKDLVAIVPVQMTEAWMLADKETLKEELGTQKNNRELGLNFPLKQLEKIADPKSKIQEIMRIAFKDLPTRKRRMQISSLYSPLGQQVRLDILEQLPSYLKFKADLTNVLIKLNFIT